MPRNYYGHLPPEQAAWEEILRQEGESMSRGSEGIVYTGDEEVLDAAHHRITKASGESGGASANYDLFDRRTHQRHCQRCKNRFLTKNPNAKYCMN